MSNRIGQTMQNYLKENQSLYLFTIVLITMGILFGALLVNSLTAAQKQELLGFLQYFFTNINTNGIPNPNIHFQQAFGYYLRTVVIMWILGLSIIGLPMILLLLFLKGIVVGFTVGFLVSQMGWQGVVYSLLGVLPQNMLVVPALLIVGVAGISFSMKLIKSRLLFSGRDRILPYFTSYTILVLWMLVVFTAAAGVETFVSPYLIQSAIK